jgi:hypothetical protein
MWLVDSISVLRLIGHIWRLTTSTLCDTSLSDSTRQHGHQFYDPNLSMATRTLFFIIQPPCRLLGTTVDPQISDPRVDIDK